MNTRASRETGILSRLGDKGFLPEGGGGNEEDLGAILEARGADPCRV